MWHLRRQMGFTAVEVAVAVFILGLAAVLVAPRIMGETLKAKRARAEEDVAAIADALHRFKVDKGCYPSTADGLAALTQPNRGNPEGYLTGVPADPWGNAYAYFTDGTRFLIKSYAADGREGGSGEDADIVSEAS